MVGETWDGLYNHKTTDLKILLIIMMVVFPCLTV